MIRTRALACGFLIAALALGAVAAAAVRAAVPASKAGGTPGSDDRAVMVEALPDGSRRVAHVQGATVVPARPLRVASIGWTDEVLALGITPVAAVGDGRRGFPEHLAERLTSTALVELGAGGPDLGALIAARPDVIVAAWYWQSSYERLARIAPTVVLQPAQQHWRLRLRDLAAVLDRNAECTAALEHLDGVLAECGQRIRERLAGRSIALLRVFAREYRLYGGKSWSGPLLYRDLGLREPACVKELGGKEVGRLSTEGVARLDADTLLLMTEEGLATSFQVRDRLRTHPVWQAMPAGHAGGIHEVPDLLMRGGILAREHSARLLAEALAP